MSRAARRGRWIEALGGFPARAPLEARVVWRDELLLAALRQDRTER